MLITIKEKRYGKNGRIRKIITPYSIGDIVTVNDTSYCLANENVNFVFGIGINYGCDGPKFPKIDRNTKYKIIDIGANFYWEALFLLRDRPGNYIVMSINISGVNALKLVEKNKKTPEYAKEIEAKF